MWGYPPRLSTLTIEGSIQATRNGLSPKKTGPSSELESGRTAVQHKVKNDAKSLLTTYQKQLSKSNQFFFNFPTRPGRLFNGIVPNNPRRGLSHRLLLNNVNLKFPFCWQGTTSCSLLILLHRRWFVCCHHLSGQFGCKIARK